MQLRTSHTSRTCRTMVTDIYISCALMDRVRSERLVRTLESLGWKVWGDWDASSRKTDPKASTGALRSARCVVVLWSADSIKSGWVRDEARAGMRRRVLVPVRIDPIEPPRGFRSVQATDLVSWDGNASAPELRELITRISAILGSPRKGEAKGTALPYWFRTLPHRSPWILTLLVGATLAGLSAWAKFHSDTGAADAEISTTSQNSPQSNLLTLDRPSEKQREEGDDTDKESLAGHDGLRKEAEPKANDQDQATKEESEELVPKSQAARVEDPDRDAYEDARALYRAGDYQGAIAAFGAVVKRSPNGPFAAKAQYWISDCWFELHDYRAAIAARQEFIAAYPDSPKQPEAMLGLAAAYTEFGDRSNARKTLEALIVRFPGTDAAWRGHKQLAKLAQK